MDKLNAPDYAGEAELHGSGEQGKRRLNIFGFSCLGGCVLVLFLPLLLLLGSYSIERYKCAKFKPTGDELLDTYAKEVIRREAPRLFASSYEVTHLQNPLVPPKRPLPGYLEDEVFEGWDGKFGDDPRFWQLRYLYTWSDSLPENFREKYGDEYDWVMLGFVDEAIENNAVDANLLWLKWAEVRRKWVDNIHGEMQAELAEGLDGKEMEVETPNYKLDKLEVERRVIDKYGDEMFSLLDQMVESSPDVSFPYFRRAIAYYCAGNMEAALVDFKAGNAAPQNEMPLCFPQQPMVDNCGSLQLCGNDVLYGILIESTLNNPRQNYGLWKATLIEIAADAIRTGDTEMLQECHLFLCRTGSAEGVDSITRIVCIVGIKVLLESWLIEEGHKLSPDQRNALLDLDRRAQKMTPGRMSSEYMDSSNWGAQTMIGNVLVLTGNYSPKLRGLVGIDFSGDYCDSEGSFKRGFERLARFSFHDLTWQVE